ncbi:MAG: thioredoxin family protein [Candidatus Thermoplasmatota archaeon]|nr:thioredoxin family protein [Candidatus Thermoplasmatota archaeon]MBS3801981.1 thioredoxin family protein [Candidatus Thermoplasmatota archaeon]
MNNNDYDRITEVCDDSLNEFINTHDRCVLLCLKEKCPYCIQFLPIVSSIAQEMPEVTFARINIDENKKTAKNLNVRTVPTIIVFYQHSVKKGIIGMKSKFTIQNDIRLAFATAHF